MSKLYVQHDYKVTGRDYVDTEGGEGGGGGVNYSTEEQATGLKWIDGSAIYQKTFDLNVSESGSTSTLLTLATGYKIIKMEGNYGPWPLNFFIENNGRAITYGLGGNTLSYRLQLWGSGTATSTITIWYTKE